MTTNNTTITTNFTVASYEHMYKDCNTFYELQQLFIINVDGARKYCRSTLVLLTAMMKETYTISYEKCTAVMDFGRSNPGVQTLLIALLCLFAYYIMIMKMSEFYRYTLYIVEERDIETDKVIRLLENQTKNLRNKVAKQNTKIELLERRLEEIMFIVKDNDMKYCLSAANQNLRRSTRIEKAKKKGAGTA